MSDSVLVRGKYRWGVCAGTSDDAVTVWCEDIGTVGGAGTHRAYISPVDAEALAGILVRQAKEIRQKARDAMGRGTTVWYRGKVECLVARSEVRDMWYLIDKVDHEVLHLWEGKADDLLRDNQYQLFKGG